MPAYIKNNKLQFMLNGKKYVLGGLRYVKIRYVSLGDSIAAGHTINDKWAENYGESSQYGKNGNVSTAIVPDSYTDLIRKRLASEWGEERVGVTSFARSGDTVADLMEKLDHTPVKTTLAKTDFATICIGANDVLEPAMSHLEEYINTGDLSVIEKTVERNLAILANETSDASYTALFNKLTKINPNARYVFTTIYNPYKYLHLDEGTNGFFGPVLNSIPSISILGFEVDEMIKQGLLNTSAIRTLYDRVNGLDEWAEKYVTKLNDVLRSRIDAYRSTSKKFLLADTKALYDTFPDRPITAERNYNDLVSVEYTRGYDTAKMDWGRLWKDSNAGSFWLELAEKYVSASEVDLEGLASDLAGQIIEKVIVPDVDPHPETYGHYVLSRSFADVLGWEFLERYNITYNANGATGNMSVQGLATLDGLTAYTDVRTNVFVHPVNGYYFANWNTAADGTGTAYTGLIGINKDTALYAQWSNVYTVTYKHSNHTDGVYGDDETGHKECYALYINGELKPKFGDFSDGNTAVYHVPYGSTIKVEVSNYNPSELTYDDVSCDVYWNGTSVSSGYRGTQYTFTLTRNVTIDFQWHIARSLLTFNARSWEDCYITTN